MTEFTQGLATGIGLGFTTWLFSWGISALMRLFINLTK